MKTNQSEVRETKQQRELLKLQRLPTLQTLGILMVLRELSPRKNLLAPMLLLITSSVMLAVKESSMMSED